MLLGITVYFSSFYIVNNHKILHVLYTCIDQALTVNCLKIHVSYTYNHPLDMLYIQSFLIIQYVQKYVADLRTSCHDHTWIKWQLITCRKSKG